MKEKEIIEFKKKVENLGLNDLRDDKIMKSLLEVYNLLSDVFNMIRVKNRNELVRELQKRKIQTDMFFQYSIPHLKTFKEYADKKFQNSLIASQNVVNLPCYPTLFDKTEELNHIVESIERCANFL